MNGWTTLCMRAVWVCGFMNSTSSRQLGVYVENHSPILAWVTVCRLHQLWLKWRSHQILKLVWLTQASWACETLCLCCQLWNCLYMFHKPPDMWRAVKNAVEGHYYAPLPPQHYSLHWASQSKDSLQAEEFQGETRPVQQPDLLPVCVPSQSMPTKGPKSIIIARLQQCVHMDTKEDKGKTDLEVRHPKVPRNPTWSQSDWSHMSIQVIYILIGYTLL